MARAPGAGVAACAAAASPRADASVPAGGKRSYVLRREATADKLMGAAALVRPMSNATAGEAAGDGTPKKGAKATKV